jgi:hypothetical protein
VLSSPPPFPKKSEFCEYDAFNDQSTLDFMASHVRQLSVELHFRSADTQSRVYANLINAGFRAFSKEANIVACDGKCAGECIEYSFLNINLLPRHIVHEDRGR